METSIQPIIFISLASIWLFYRLYRFLSIPVLNIVRYLNIQTPYATKVSIDKITGTSITIHWDNQLGSNIQQTSDQRSSTKAPASPQSDECDNNPEVTSDLSISHYILYLNKIQVGIFPNSEKSLYTCCLINGLSFDTEYQIDLVTVNYMGFINKVPSIHLMTKTKKQKTDKSDATNKNWKRNITPLNDIDLTDDVPRYSELNKLEDLKNYSIKDLKKVLICLQEDLHYVTKQRSNYTNEFQDSKVQLQLELNNLKNVWFHEIEIKKSLKSNIKSLENSKLLYDAKLSNLNKKIENSIAKVLRMNNDMDGWSNESSKTSQHILKYEKKVSETEASIEELKTQIQKTQVEIDQMKGEIKTLETEYMALDMKEDTPTILKQIDEMTSEETGLLNSTGQAILSKLTGSSNFYNLITDQLNIDSKLNSAWNGEKKAFQKNIHTYKIILKQASAQNNTLKSNIMINPYSDFSLKNKSFSNTSLSLLMNEHSPIPKSRSFTDALSLSDIPPLANQHLQALPLSTVNSGSHFDFGDDYLHIPSPQLSFQDQPFANNANTITSQLTHGIPTTATVKTNATASPSKSIKSVSDTNHQTLLDLEVDKYKFHENDQQFDNDISHHVITGLKDMIYEDMDRIDKVSINSKGFTNDQLDDFWTNKNRSGSFFASEKDEHQTTSLNPDAFKTSNDFISPITSLSPIPSKRLRAFTTPSTNNVEL